MLSKYLAPQKSLLWQRLFHTPTHKSVDTTQTIDDKELAAIFNNLHAIKDLRVGDIMVPRADIVALNANATLEQAAECFVISEHSRLPVYRDTLDDPLGFVHLKDLVPLLVRGEKSVQIERLVRNILFVPPSVLLLELLLQMQSRRLHMALIVDEYGGTDGLVTIEDIMEQIVGRIDDEHDIDTPLQPIIRGTGIIEADARVKITDLTGVLACAPQLCQAAIEGDIDTIGGLIVSLVGRVPQRGEIVVFDKDIEMQVIDADPRRVRRLRITETMR